MPPRRSIDRETSWTTNRRPPVQRPHPRSRAARYSRASARRPPSPVGRFRPARAHMPSHATPDPGHEPSPALADRGRPAAAARLGHRRQPDVAGRPAAHGRRDEGRDGRRHAFPTGDDGGVAWAEYPTENDAQFFAFLSLVHPDEAARADYAERARTLLMYAIDEAAKGPAEGEPFRDPYFSVFDRSRWWGAGFPADRRLDLPAPHRRGQGDHPRGLPALDRREHRSPRSRATYNHPAAGRRGQRSRPPGRPGRRPLGRQQLLHRPHAQHRPDGARLRPGRRPGRGADRQPGAARPAPGSTWSTPCCAATPAAASPPRASSTARWRSPTSSSSCSPCTPPARTIRRRGDRRWS